jgi:hypothetical protein
MSSCDSRDRHQPSDPSGTVNAVRVTCPVPCTPGLAFGHGKNVRIVPGVPTSSA